MKKKKLLKEKKSISISLSLFSKNNIIESCSKYFDEEYETGNISDELERYLDKRLDMTKSSS